MSVYTNDFELYPLNDIITVYETSAYILISRKRLVCIVWVSIILRVTAAAAKRWFAESCTAVVAREVHQSLMVVFTNFQRLDDESITVVVMGQYIL